MAQKKPKLDPKREERITNEIIVDCYNEYERATGWCCYLEEQLHFPFKATCISKRVVSPLQVKDEVEVIGMAPEKECEREAFVIIKWERPEGLAVPLAQLKPTSHTDKETKEAVADWHYWVDMRYG